MDANSDFEPVEAIPDVGSPWARYLEDRDDVVGYVALALHFRNLLDRGDVFPEIQEALAKEGLWTDNAIFSYRAAAERIVNTSLTTRAQQQEQLDKSTDPLFLLLKSEFRAHADSVSRDLSSLRRSTSLPKQVQIAALSGIVISVFVLLVTLIPGSIESMLQTWSSVGEQEQRK